MLFMLLVPTQENTKNAQKISIQLEQQLARIAGGETAALEELYLLTQSAVYGFALSFLRNHQSAEDIMQDTYVTIYEKAALYRPKGKPMAWILTITRNLCLMRLRKKDTLPLDEVTLPPANDNFTQNSLDRLVLQAALTLLSPEERQIVMLHSLCAMKHREIAQMMRLPLGTVLAKYRRALLKLKNHIKEEAP